MLLQTAIIAVLVATLGGVASSVSDSFSALTQQAEQREKEEQIVATLHKDPEMPLDAQIKAREAALPKLEDPEKRGAVKQELVELYTTCGIENEDAGNLTQAEKNYTRALELNPQDATCAANIASLYTVAAKRYTDIAQRRALLEDSARYWMQAQDHENQPIARRQYADQAAQTYVDIAVDLVNAGMAVEAIRSIGQARELAAPGSQLSQRIDRLEQGLQREVEE